MGKRVSAMRAFVTGECPLVEVVGEFTDDHELGCVVAFGPEKTQVAFAWCGSGTVGAFTYASDSKRAMADAIEAVNNELENGDDDETEDTTAPEGWLG